MPTSHLVSEVLETQTFFKILYPESLRVLTSVFHHLLFKDCFPEFYPCPFRIYYVYSRHCIFKPVYSPSVTNKAGYSQTVLYRSPELPEFIYSLYQFFFGPISGPNCRVSLPFITPFEHGA